MSTERDKIPLSARIMKASRILQSKAGFGDIAEKTITESQRIIDDNTVDFKPMAEEFLANLDVTVKVIKDTEDYSQKMKEKISAPVMQIKANAAMFNYPLLTSLAGVVLNLLESVEKLDRDVVEIVETHSETLRVLLKNNMAGDGGEYGVELEAELRNACKRYYAKNSAVDFVDNKDVFFVD